MTKNCVTKRVGLRCRKHSTVPERCCTVRAEGPKKKAENRNDVEWRTSKKGGIK